MNQLDQTLKQAYQALQNQDWQLSKSCFDAVLNAKNSISLSQNTAALCGLGTWALAQQNPQAAIDYLLQALQLSALNPDTHYSLGLAYYAANQTELAITHLRQTTAHQPEHALAWTRLGQIYTRHGMPFYGFSCLEKAQTLRPDESVDPLTYSLAAWQTGLWGPFLAWFETSYRNIVDRQLRMDVYSRWLDLLSYQAEYSDSQVALLLKDWEQYLPTRLSLLPTPPARLLQNKAVLKVACLSLDSVHSHSLLQSFSEQGALDFKIWTPDSPFKPDQWRESQEQTIEPLLPALQKWEPDLVLEQVGLSQTFVQTLSRQLPKSIWLRASGPDQLSPEIAGSLSLQFPPLCLNCDSGFSALAYPNGERVVGYAGPVRALSNATLQLWSQLLLAQPRLRLCIFSPEIDDPLMRQYLEQIFQNQGISGYRLRLLGSCASQDPLPFFHGQVHLVLAPFPRSFAMHTLQAFGMGRPVLALSHPQWKQRNQAVEVLERLNFKQGIVFNSEAFLDRAQTLLADLPEPAVLHQHVLDSESVQVPQAQALWAELLKEIGFEDVL
jgi:tetratricopeptide (TPR) repeat protein